jgi:hypothetical protein
MQENNFKIKPIAYLPYKDGYHFILTSNTGKYFYKLLQSSELVEIDKIEASKAVFEKGYKTSGLDMEWFGLEEIQVLDHFSSQ